MTRGQQPQYRPRARYRVDDGYVDDVAVDRALAGDITISLTRTETDLVVDALTRLGYSTAETSIRAGITNRHVSRVRARLREQVAA